MGLQPLWVMLVLAFLAGPLAAQHRSGGSHSGGHSRSSHLLVMPLVGRLTPPAPASGANTAARRRRMELMRQTGHPHGWPGHVADHIVPLACGGADAPSNMPWQTVEDAKAKDRVEREGCEGQWRR